MIKKKLEALDQEIQSHREKVSSLKKENETLQVEIESTQGLKSEYLSFLEVKKSEREEMLKAIQIKHEKFYHHYSEQKRELNMKYQQRTDDLRKKIAMLESKYEHAQQELQDNAPLGELQKANAREIAQLEAKIDEQRRAHMAVVKARQAVCVDEKVALQKKVNAELQHLKTVAPERAAEYLVKYTKQLEQENEKLQERLTKCIARSHIMLEQKQSLEKNHIELLREQAIKNDLLQLHLKRAIKASNQATRMTSSIPPAPPLPEQE